MFSQTTDLIMQFFEVAKKVEGRIRLQKVTYILQTKGIVNFELDYKYALYGPYSQDLQLEIDYLKSIGFIRETTKNNYTYELVSDFPIPVKVDSQISSHAILIQNLLVQESQLLELTSTIYYLKAYQYKTRPDIEKKLALLKPSLKKKIAPAFEFYRLLENPI